MQIIHKNMFTNIKKKSEWIKVSDMLHYAESPQSCPTLCDPIDGSPPGSPVPGILQAGTLEWVDISFSNAGKGKVKVKPLSRVRLLATPWTAAHRLLLPWDFPGKSTGVGCHCLLQSIRYCLANQKHYFFMTELLTGNTIKLFFWLNGFWLFFFFFHSTWRQ